MDSKTKCSSWRYDYPAPSSVEADKILLPPLHIKLRSDDELSESMHGPNFAQLSDSCMKHSPIQHSAKQGVKREFLWILRFESSSKMTGSTTYMFNILTCSKRVKHGMLFT